MLAWTVDSSSYASCAMQNTACIRYKATRNQYDKVAAFGAGQAAWREAHGSVRDMEELIEEIVEFLSVRSDGAAATAF